MFVDPRRASPPLGNNAELSFINAAATRQPNRPGLYNIGLYLQHTIEPVFVDAEPTCRNGFDEQHL